MLSFYLSMKSWKKIEILFQLLFYRKQWFQSKYKWTVNNAKKKWRTTRSWQVPESCQTGAKGNAGTKGGTWKKERSTSCKICGIKCRVHGCIPSSAPSSRNSNRFAIPGGTWSLGLWTQQHNIRPLEFKWKSLKGIVLCVCVYVY